jgi:glucosamine 6-phosphate synthetase-like amidotransferase/phosphosugar isomerase protein
MNVDDNVSLDWDNMLHGIRAQIDFLQTAPRSLYDQWVNMIANVPLPNHLYLVGCGDSYYCGMAAEQAFKEFSGVRTIAMEALEFSRYQLEFSETGDWLVATSNSGNVSRTVESVIRARKRGLQTWGISYNFEGRLAKEAHDTLFYRYSDVGFGPGTISYTASMVSQITLAAALADRVRPTSGAGTELIAQLTQMSRTLDQALEMVFDQAVDLGRRSASTSQIVVIGAGPNYATALFGMAKQIESAHHNTVGQELEEWAHEQYFCTHKGTLTIVLAPPGRSRDRAQEQLQAIRDMGGTAAVVCAASDEETGAMADVDLRVPDTSPSAEWLTPLLYQIPLQIFSYAFAQAIGSVMLGFDDRERMRVNFRQIFGSAIHD